MLLVEKARSRLRPPRNDLLNSLKPFFKRMFRFLSRLVLNSRFPGHAAAPKAFLPWDRIQRIAIIMGAESQPGKNLVDQFILDTRKFVEVLFIETKSKQA